MEHDLPKEPPVAICFLERDNDKKNQCLLSENFLTVIRKGKITTFHLDEIQRLIFTQRKYMLPLIIGGVFAPLSVIAISENLFNPWGILIWLMLNLMLVYIGWLGFKALTVNFKDFHRDFPIRSYSSNLKEFVAFANEYIVKRKISSTDTINPVYHIIDAAVWEIAKEESFYEPDSLKKDGFIHLCRKNQIQSVINRYYPNQTRLLLLEINPLKLKHELKYEMVYENEALYPHLYGPLNTSAVMSTKALG